MMRLPALLRTSVFQLTLIYMALFGVSVAALFALMYWSTVGFLERHTVGGMDGVSRGVREHDAPRHLVGLVEIIRDRVRRPGQERSVYLLVDAGLRPLAGNMSYWPPGFGPPAALVELV